MLNKIALRPASLADSRFIFNLRNDPLVIKNSVTSPRRVTWVEHKRWYARALVKDNIFIITSGLVRVGDVRIVDGNPNEIGIRVCPRHRCRGIGTEAIRIADKFAERPIVALIRKENAASIKIFRRNGYTKHSESDGVVLLHKRRRNPW